MRAVFNSLGSNYSFADASVALSSLLGFGDSSAKSNVSQKLTQTFLATPFFFYKGRDAIEFGLRVAGFGEGDVVISQAFTCYAIEEAVVRTGARVEYADIDPQTGNLTVSSVKQAVERCTSTENVRAVFCQHVLGIPAQSGELKAYCKKHNVLFIEDLAQGFGGTDVDGKPVGSEADIIILSFGRDKIIDAVSGGACLFPEKSIYITEAKKQYQQLEHLKVPWFAVLKGLSYPLLTWIIQHTWNIGVGKVLLKFLQLTKFFTSPITSETQTAMPLPAAYFALLWRQVSTVEQRIAQRREKLQLYFEQFKKLGYTIHFDIKTVLRGSGLRMPLLVANPSTLTHFLQSKKYYFSDRWYRSPVDCGSFRCATSYTKDLCPEAEATAQKIYNLPTHQFVSKEAVKEICKHVGAFL